MSRAFYAVILFVACASNNELAKRDDPVEQLRNVTEAGTTPPSTSPPKPEEPKGPMQPATRTQLIEDIIHTTKVKDPFRWLEDEKSKEVQEWMAGQDAYTRAELAKLSQRDGLAKRFAELFYIDAVSAPIKRGGRYFYTRRLKTQEKAIVYWRQGETKGAPEKVLLDPNALVHRQHPAVLARHLGALVGRQEGRVRREAERRR